MLAMITQKEFSLVILGMQPVLLERVLLMRALIVMTANRIAARVRAALVAAALARNLPTLQNTHH
jgi:hypothetical protein